MYLIGTDEAGYAPNYGPLVVSATLWRLPIHLHEADLYEVLRDYVTPDCVKDDDSRLPIADSKKLYCSGGSWEQLELGLLAALAVCGKSCSQWRDIWHALAPDELPRVDDEPGHRQCGITTPHAACPRRIAGYAERLTQGLRHASVQLCAIVSRPVFPPEYNRLCQESDNKATVLSHVTLGLVRDLINLANIDGPLLVCCDKHGGRNFYAALLQHFF